MRLYCAGPMSANSFGIEFTPRGWDYNYPAFAAMSDQLDAAGYLVESPAAGDDVPGWGWVDYMRRGIAQLILCDGVATLPGWERSRGARVEIELARGLGLPVRPGAKWLKVAVLGSGDECSSLLG